MCDKIAEEWARRMRPEMLEKAVLLSEWAEKCKEKGENILPAHIFRALDLTAPESVHCVILGQDPYPTPGVANGLAFSANSNCKIPASLRNIFKELANDLNCPIPKNPDLTPWAERGVLLLNTSLTVRANAPASHAKWGWAEVTGDILRVCMELPQPIVFLFWGAYARAVSEKLDFIGHKNKKALFSSHPSPLGASKGNKTISAFFGSKPFSKTNEFLISMGVPPIHWDLS